MRAYIQRERHENDHKEIEKFKVISIYTNYMCSKSQREKYLATSQQAIDRDQLSIKSLGGHNRFSFRHFRFLHTFGWIFSL